MVQNALGLVKGQHVLEYHRLSTNLNTLRQTVIRYVPIYQVVRGMHLVYQHSMGTAEKVCIFQNVKRSRKWILNDYRPDVQSLVFAITKLRIFAICYLVIANTKMCESVFYTFCDSQRVTNRPT